LATAFLLLLASTAQAQSMDAWHHRAQKATLIGGAVLGAAGSEPGGWLAVYADNPFYEEPYFWSTYVTTAYALEVCEDGRAFIVRSGEGVDVDVRVPGEAYTFYWSEDYWPCDDIFVEGTDGDAAAAALMDRNRVLETKKVRRTARK
jgi:hypothetical protein